MIAYYYLFESRGYFDLGLRVLVRTNGKVASDVDDRHGEKKVERADQQQRFLGQIRTEKKQEGSKEREEGKRRKERIRIERIDGRDERVGGLSERKNFVKTKKAATITTPPLQLDSGWQVKSRNLLIH